MPRRWTANPSSRVGIPVLPPLLAHAIWEDIKREVPWLLAGEDGTPGEITRRYYKEANTKAEAIIAEYIRDLLVGE